MSRQVGGHEPGEHWIPGAGFTTWLVVLAAAAVAGCVTAPGAVRDREAHWRQVLAGQAPAGTSRADVVAMFERNDLPVSEGTYRTIRDDGKETSNCRIPDRAVSGLERGAVRGLYIEWDIEVTVCFDENDVVEDHFVGAWNAGL